MFFPATLGAPPTPPALIFTRNSDFQCNSWSNQKAHEAQKSTDNGKQTRVLDVKLKTLKKAT